MYFKNIFLLHLSIGFNVHDNEIHIVKISK